MGIKSGIKSGLKTTEFWVIAILQACNAYQGYSGAITPANAGQAAVFMGMVYAICRTIVKLNGTGDSGIAATGEGAATPPPATASNGPAAAVVGRVGTVAGPLMKG